MKIMQVVTLIHYCMLQGDSNLAKALMQRAINGTLVKEGDITQKKDI